MSDAIDTRECLYEIAPKACWDGTCPCPATCNCVGLGCDHAGTRLSWAHPKPRKVGPMDPRRYACDSMPEGQRAAARIAKADALHDMACRIQDQLPNVGIFHGDDEKLLRAKMAIDEACTKARNVADRIRHGGR